MLLFEIVFRFNFWIAVFENIDKAGNNLLYFALGELGANPDDEAGYFGHRGLPPDGWPSNHIQSYFGRRGKSHLKRKEPLWKCRHCGKRGKVITKVQEIPVPKTFPHFPQCLGFRFAEPTFPQSRRRLFDIDFKSKS
jgi:hypothetical protein